MSSQANAFLAAPVGRVLLRTALPIIFLTSVNGLLTVADAILLGSFVGPEALTAVTLLFPVSMLLVALATMVSSGMASVLARQIGAGAMTDARKTFAGAHGLTLAVCAAAVLLFVPFSRPLVGALTGGDAGLSAMAGQFLLISVLSAPLLFVLSVHSDALRVEGRVGFMALAGLLVSLSNLAFNVLLIVGLHWGVAGSALGTAAAQAVALAVVLRFRARGKAQLSLSFADRAYWRTGWHPILALGAPRSLSFIGIALGSAATILGLRLFAAGDIEATIAAYGVITRLMTFAYLPLLGLSLGMQAVAGNNLGAGQPQRATATLKLALGGALAYCLLVELALLVFRGEVGGLFVGDAAVVREVDRIMPFYVAGYFTLGPLMMLASFLQSIGDARRSALLSLARTYLFAVPLTFTLPWLLGETGIWLSLPAADLLVALVAAGVLWRATGRLQRVVQSA